MDPLEPTSMVDRVFGDRYRIVELIGAGAASQVFVAEDRDSGTRVALKVFAQSLGADPEIAESITAAIARAALVQHANIAAILDHGIDGVRIWVASELCGGASLRALLEHDHCLTPSQALVVALECARGLAHAHLNGLVHGALKPENVLFSSDQRLRLTDFGLDQVLGDTSPSNSDLAVQRVRYIAPEQAGGSDAAEQADIYSLALTINEAVCGEPPAAGETAVATLAIRAQAPGTLSAELGPLRPSLERCCRQDPDDRPEADELAIALLAAAETMSRPGALPLVGVPGFDDAAWTAIDATDNPAPFEQVQVPGIDGLDETNDGPPSLVVVPDLPDRVALEDLDTVEPAFVDTGPDRSDFDVPTAASAPVRPAAVFREDTEALDDDLARWPLAVLGLLVAGAIAAWFVFSASTGAGTQTVPNLVGLGQDQVADFVADGGWRIERLETRINGSTPGSVVAQNPDVGVELGAGEVLSVTFSLGGEMVEIPSDLAGLTLPQAQDRLAGAGLLVGTVTEENSEAVDTELVIGVDEPTRQKPQGEAVALRVSLGPEDRIVPESIIGTSIADATAVLTGLRLQAVEEQVHDPAAETGTVLGAMPSPGKTVPADSQVTLLVSAGPEPVIMPDLAELDLAAAVDLIESLDLIFLDTEGSPGEPVIGTIPAAGELVDVRTEVIIVLAEPEDGDEESEDG